MTGPRSWPLLRPTPSRRCLLSLPALLLACATTPPSPAAQGAPPAEPGLRRLTLVATNDLHGWVEPRESKGEPIQGGVDMLAAYLRVLRQQRPGEVLLLDAGDLFQGTLVASLTEGSVVIKAYNLLGYDAVAVGNHEFDYGPVGESSVAVQAGDDPVGNLKARMAQANFPFLVGNVFDKATNRPVQWPHASRTLLKEINGVKVGVLGLSTPTTPLVTLSKNVESLTFPELAPTAVELAAQLRAQGAQVVVALVHAGAGCGCLGEPKAAATCEPTDLSSCSTRSELARFLDQLPEGTVDAAIGGHTHEYLAHFLRGVPSIQSGHGGAAFGAVELYWDTAAGRLARERTKIWKPTSVCRKVSEAGTCAKDDKGPFSAPVFLGEKLEPVAEVAQALSGDIAAVKRLKEERLGPVLARRFGRDRQAESELGDFVTDIMKAAVPGATLAVTNSGGLRADLEPGPLTYGAVFNALPFDNRLALLKLSGEELVRMLSLGVSYNHGILQVSGLRLEVVERGMDTCLPDGSRLVSATFADGSPIDPKASYVVVTNDFLAAGGDAFGPLVSRLDASRNETRWDLPPLRDVVVAHFRANPAIDGPPPPGAARIRFVRPACGAIAPQAKAPAHP